MRLINMRNSPKHPLTLAPVSGPPRVHGPTCGGGEVGEGAQTGEREPGGGQRGSRQHQHQDQLQHPPNGVRKPVREENNNNGETDPPKVTRPKTRTSATNTKRLYASAAVLVRHRRHASFPAARILLRFLSLSLHEQRHLILFVSPA